MSTTIVRIVHLHSLSRENKMRKIQRSVRLSPETIAMVEEVSNSGMGMSWTHALELLVKQAHLVRSISVSDRDKLRVSCKNGKYAATYDKHEKKMIDFFLV